MPGTMQNIECELADLDPVSLFQPPVGRHVCGVVHTVRAGRLNDLLQQKRIGPVRAFDRYFELCLQAGGGADVIDMAVGQPDFLDRNTGFGNGALDVREVAAGIDDHGTLARLAPQHRAVLLKRGDLDDDSLGFGHARLTAGMGYGWYGFLRAIPITPGAMSSRAGVQ